MNISPERLAQLLDIERKYLASKESKHSLPSNIGELKVNNASLSTPGRALSTPRNRSIPRVKTPKKNSLPKLQKQINQKNRKLHKIGKKTFVDFNGRQRWVTNIGGDEFKLRDDKQAKGEEKIRFRINYYENDGRIERKVEHNDEQIEGKDFLLAGDDRKEVVLKVGDNIFKSETSGKYYRGAQSNNGRRIWAIPIDDPFHRDIDISNFTKKIDGKIGGVRFTLRNADIPLTSINADGDIKDVEENKRKVVNAVRNLINIELPKIPDFKSNKAVVAFNIKISRYDYDYENDLKTVSDDERQQRGFEVNIPLNEEFLITQINNMITKYSISDKNVTLNTISVLFLPIPAGGCQKLKGHRPFGIKRLRDGTVIAIPNTGNDKNNNCFFYCFKEEFKEKLGIDRLPRSLCNQYRKKYGLKDDCKVDIVTGAKMVKDILGLNVGFCNQSREYFGDIDGEKFDVTLMLYGEHYVIVVSDSTWKKCEYCGKKYLNKHSEMACKQKQCRMLNINTKKRTVLPKKLTPKGWEDCDEMEHTIHYDIESYRDSNGVSIANAIGWIYRGTYRYLFGEDCIDRFVDTLLTDKTYKEAFFLNAFNGSSFDHLFILNRAEKRLGLDKIRPMKSTQGIISAWVGNTKLIDVRMHMSGTLDDCLKAFGCTISKGSFNHNLNGPNLNLELKKELLDYLEKDVRGLCELSTKLHLEYKKEYGASWVHCVTISQMSYNIWKTTIPDDATAKILLPTEKEYKFIKKSLYGGRSTVHRRFYQSKYWKAFERADENKGKIGCEEIIDEQNPLRNRLSMKIKMTKEEFDAIDDYLLDLDVCSLYPKAMTEKYPIGDAIDTLEYVPGKLGIYKCKYIPNKKLLVPALPRHENKGLKWDLLDCLNPGDDEGVYTSIDIETARKYGYKVEVLNGVYWKESSDVFKGYIEKNYLKKQNSKKGTPPYAMAKLLMNALYGKTMQKPRIERTFFVTDRTHWNDIIPNYYITYIDAETFDNVWIVTAEMKNPKLLQKAFDKPTQLGVFVLAYSRRIMMEYMDRLGALWNKDNQLYYTDTDSIQIHGSQLTFPLGNEIGMLSNELGNSKILRGTWVAPKMYLLEYLQLQPDGSVLLIGNRYGKGVKKESGTLPIDSDDFQDMCEGYPLEVENKDMFKKIYYKLNSKQVEKGIDTFSVVIGNQKKVLNRKTWDGRIFDDDGNSVPKGYCFE